MQAPPADAADWLDEADPTTRRLVVAALHEFAAAGYHGASTRAIANRAGMSPAAVYISFDSKAALLARISTDGHRDIQRLLDRLAAMHPDPVQRLFASVAEFVAWHATHQELARVVQYHLDALEPAAYEEVATIRRAQEQHLRDLLADAAAVAGTEPPDLVLSARAIASMAIDVARWYRPGSRPTPAELGNRYAGYALRIIGCADPNPAP